MKLTSKPAVFIDRDGTVCEEKHYLSSPEDLILIPGASRAIKRLNDLGVLVILVTNQSGIARGYFSEQTLALIHDKLSVLLSYEDAHIDATFFCPHHLIKGIPPYNVDCDCRKPKTGMIIEAMNRFPIDLSHSCVIGDKLSDTKMGMKLGLQSILVKTGYGNTALNQGQEGVDYSLVVPSITEAVDQYLAGNIDLDN